MALLTHRDPVVVGNALAGWIAARLGVRDVRVTNAEHPSIGYSSETVLVDLAWSDDGGGKGEQTRELVVRLAPPTVGTFRDYDLGVADHRAAGGRRGRRCDRVTGARLRPPLARRPVRGDAAGTRLHHRRVRRRRPVAETLTELQRAQVHEHFVGQVAATHRADLAAAAGVPERDNGAELDFWADYLDWSSGGAPVPTLVDGTRMVPRPPTRNGIRTCVALG